MNAVERQSIFRLNFIMIILRIVHKVNIDTLASHETGIIVVAQHNQRNRNEFVSSQTLETSSTRIDRRQSQNANTQIALSRTNCVSGAISVDEFLFSQFECID